MTIDAHNLDPSRDRRLRENAVRYSNTALMIAGVLVAVAAVVAAFFGGTRRIDGDYSHEHAPAALTGVVQLLAEQEQRPIESYEGEPVADIAARAEVVFGSELPSHWDSFLQQPTGSGWQRFLASYLVGFTFVVSIALGCLFFVLMQHLTRAGWSVVVRRVAELAAASLAPLALLSLPILVLLLLGDHTLFEWNSAELLATDELIQHKRPYLNPGFFLVRCLVYFAIWGLLGRHLLSLSRAQDASGDPGLTLRMQKISPVGTLLFALSINFFAFDFLMSLAPHWFSAVYGVYYFAGSVVAGLSFIIIATAWLQRIGVVGDEVTVEHYHDLGKLLFGFMFFWGYIAFSQYLLIWYANIPEETVWYLVRQQNGWQWVSVALLFGHLLIPFFGLMSRKVRRSKPALLIGASWMLAVHLLDLYWNVIPQFAKSPSLHAIDLLLPVALAAFFVAALFRTSARGSVVAEQDPRLRESLAFHNV